MVAHDCRLVMGPGRKGEVYGIVALVPDGKTMDGLLVSALMSTDQLNEDPNAKQSWVSEGNLSKMLETFAAFPSWVTRIFKCVIPRSCGIWMFLTVNRHSADLGLWQLRDLVSIISSLH